jgi:hypothetical protein
MNRIRMAASAAILCALVAATPAAAETGNSAPIRDLSDSGFIVPAITGPEAPEEYPARVSLGARQELVQLTSTEVGVKYSDGVISFILDAEQTHDAEGAAVPVTLAVTGEDLVTKTVHHREGNPAAGFAQFKYPITAGAGWEGGSHTFIVELNEPKPPAPEPPTAAPNPTPTPAPAPACMVPSLRGFGLVAAKKLLRGADCGIGQVHLARGATKGKGKVVKQFEPAGSQLTAGAPVAVKLAGR